MKHPLPRGWQKIYFNNHEYLKIIDGDRGINYPKQNDFFNNGYCVFLNTKNVTKYGFNFDDVKYINKEKDEKLRSGKLKKYDIVMTTRGTIGNIAFYDDKVSFENIRINSGMIIFRVLSNNIFHKYLYIFLSSSIMKKQISNYLSGMAQPQLPISSIHKLYFLLPPIEEQKYISKVLSLCDELIENLTKLIEKKELYKKGVMQRVLSGEVRFNGFTDEWKEVKLSDICKNIKTGKLDANAMEENGKYRFYTCAKEYYKINTYAFDGEALLISGNGAYVGYIHYYNGKFNAYQRTYVLMDFTENITYIKYYLDKYLQHRIKKEKNEGNTPYIVLNTLTDMKIKLPSLEEQNKIAELLTLIDKDIENLKQLLHLRKLQKKGLMQKLLTGEVRI